MNAQEIIWRRERDSNPRYRFRYSGFQVHRRVPSRLENFLLYSSFQQLTSQPIASVLLVNDWCGSYNHYNFITVSVALPAAISK